MLNPILSALRANAIAATTSIKNTTTGTATSAVLTVKRNETKVAIGIPGESHHRLMQVIERNAT